LIAFNILFSHVRSNLDLDQSRKCKARQDSGFFTESIPDIRVQVQ